MASWMVAPGPASKELGEQLAKRLSLPMVEVHSTVFPDGECKIRITGDVRGKRVIVVQSTYPPTDTHLLQALMLSHRVSQDGGEVYALIPYLAYARQDKEFLQGEIVSLAVVSRLLRAVGVKRLVTVDIHSVEGLGHFSFPAYSVSAIPALAEYVKQHYSLHQPIVVSPDFGASARAEGFAKLLSSEHIVLRKTRDRVTGEVRVEEERLEVEDRDVVMVDDIISTGGSVEKAAKLLKKHGAGRIIVACTHLVMVRGAMERISKAGVEEVIGTNTIPHPSAKVDITPLIAEHFTSIMD